MNLLRWSAVKFFDSFARRRSASRLCLGAGFLPVSWASAAVVACVTAFSGCYSLRQAFHQNNIYNSRRQVSALIADPRTASDLKHKLQYAREVIAYAASRGLVDDGNYRHYIDIGDKPVSYLVKAAPPFEMNFKTWWFPVIGSVPYLGFFSEAERDGMATELRSAGLDVHVTGAAAFSGLGWFEDPIYSSMLDRGDEAVAHLFFHELTHRTFWIPDQVNANENLAEFVADLLVADFLKRRGKARELEAFQLRRRDEQLFQGWIKGLKEALEAAYAAGKDGPEAELAKRKADIIASALAPERRPPLHDQKWNPFDRFQWNNATILSFGLYGMESEKFAAAFRCLGGDLPVFFTRILELSESRPELLDRIDEAFCRTQD